MGARTIVPLDMPSLFKIISFVPPQQPRKNSNQQFYLFLQIHANTASILLHWSACWWSGGLLHAVKWMSHLGCWWLLVAESSDSATWPPAFKPTALAKAGKCSLTSVPMERPQSLFERHRVNNSLHFYFYRSRKHHIKLQIWNSVCC